MLDQLKENKHYLPNPGERLDFGEEKWGFFLFNMGGPEKSEDVKDFLYNVFSDSNIIRLPFSRVLQKPLARFISRRRAPKARPRFCRVGSSGPSRRRAGRRSAVRWGRSGLHRS